MFLSDRTEGQAVLVVYITFDCIQYLL